MTTMFPHPSVLSSDVLISNAAATEATYSQRFPECSVSPTTEVKCPVDERPWRPTLIFEIITALNLLLLSTLDISKTQTEVKYDP